MTKIKVTLFRDFVEDGRISMEVYATNLIDSLNLLNLEQLDFKEFQPHIPSWLKSVPEKYNLRMRTARYCVYPLQARAHQGKLNHIIDHSYAHLTKVLNPESCIITVHDLIPQLAWKGLIPGLSYPHNPFLNKLSLGFLEKAIAIIAVSHSTKRDLINHCGLQENRISVVHNGLNNIFHPVSEEFKITLRLSFKFPDLDTHVVLITGNQPYKNHINSLRVIERLQVVSSKPIQLVCLGANNAELDKCLTKIKINNPIIRLTGLSNHRLVELYNSIDCLLFPSWYEGFGWPPLEAMACGTPVVTSNIASLTEIVGDAAPMAAPDDVEMLTEAVLMILEDKAKRLDFINKGFQNVSRFNWNQCALEVTSVYKTCLGNER